MDQTFLLASALLIFFIGIFLGLLLGYYFGQYIERKKLKVMEAKAILNRKEEREASKEESESQQKSTAPAMGAIRRPINNTKPTNISAEENKEARKDYKMPGVPKSSEEELEAVKQEEKAKDYTMNSSVMEKNRMDLLKSSNIRIAPQVGVEPALVAPKVNIENKEAAPVAKVLEKKQPSSQDTTLFKGKDSLPMREAVFKITRKTAPVLKGVGGSYSLKERQEIAKKISDFGKFGTVLQKSERGRIYKTMAKERLRATPGERVKIDKQVRFLKKVIGK